MKLKSLLMAALAAAFVFVCCDKGELQDPNKSDQTEQTDPNNPGGTEGTDPDNPGGTDPEDPENPGGTDPDNPDNPGGTDPDNPDNPGGTDPEDPENPGGTDPEDPENPGGTDPEDPDNPADTIQTVSLMEFLSLPASDQVYRISGVIWEMGEEYVIIGDVPYDDEFLPETTGYAVIENLKDQGFRPGDVLTVVGKRGDDPEEGVLVDAVYESHKDYDQPFLMVPSSTKPILEATNATFELEVYSNCTWSVALPEGVTATPASGDGDAVVKFTFPDNNKIQEMVSYWVTFTYNGKQLKYKFQQMANMSGPEEPEKPTPVLTLEPTSAEVAADAKSYELSVTSNVAWAATASDGVTLNPATGNGDGKVVLTFEANTAYKPVTYIVTFKADDLEDQTFTLTQAAAEKPARNLAFSAATATVTLGNEFTAPTLSGLTEGVVYSSSNTDVATVNTTTGAVALLAAGETTITAIANETATHLADSASYTLIVKPTPVLTLEPTSAEVAADAKSYELSVTSNVAWAATASDGVTLNPATGNGDGKVVLTFEANTAYKPVTYIVTFKADDLEDQTFTLTQAAAEKPARNLAFAASEATATLGEAFTAPTLSGETEGVEYRSSNTAVATVDAATGAVTLVAAGETTITATAAEDETFLAGTASYVLTVAEPFVPVIEDGKYWIVANNLVAKPVTSSFGYLNVEDAWKSASSVASTQANAFTFTSVEGGYTIQDEAGKYYYGTVYNNAWSKNFNVSATLPAEGAIWKIVKNDDDTYTITNTTQPSYLQYSVSYNSFGHYTTAQSNAVLPTLVKVENAVPAVTLEASLTFEAEGGSQTITLPEGVSATTSCDNAAFTATASANVVTVSAAATTEAQSGVLTLVLNYNGFAITKTVDLTQKAAPVAGEEVLLDEDFSSLKTWSTSAVTSLTANNLTYTTAGGAMYGQKGCIKFGKSSAAANTGVKLPALSSLTAAKTVTLTFKAVSSDSGYTMNVAASAGATVGTLSPKAITKYEGGAINSGADTATKLAEAFAASTAEFSVTIQNVTAQTVITITASGSAKRWYLDDVKIVAQ